MRPSPLAQRRRISAAGASDALAAYLGAVRAGTPLGTAAARALARCPVDWRSVRGDIVNAHGAVVLAEMPDGPLLAARYFDPDGATSIHDHGGAGAALVVEGRDRYERFERTGPRAARLESIHDLAAGDVVWWSEPPGDVHRQTGQSTGAIELILLDRAFSGGHDFADASEPSSELRAALVAGFLDGDVTRLAPWYAGEVLLDANVPEWRFQIRGRDNALAGLEHEEFTKPDRRVTMLRATETAGGLLLETELRFSEAGELRQCREAHHLRIRDEQVVEHVVWCTGIADAATVLRQLIDAPVERM